jgi:hypothetical protein
MIADRGFFLYLLIFIGIVAFNLIRQQRANQARQRAMQRTAGQQPLPPAADEESESPFDWEPSEPKARVPQAGATPAEGPGGKRLTETWGKGAAAVGSMAATPSAPSATAMQMQRRGMIDHSSARGPFFKSTKELRHAVATMTVLGRCRALEPYD